MKKYLINYDLDKPGQDYTRLINRLKELGAIRDGVLTAVGSC